MSMLLAAVVLTSEMISSVTTLIIAVSLDIYDPCPRQLLVCGFVLPSNTDFHP